MSSTQTQADYRIENHGSLFLFQPLTSRAWEWLEENADGQWHGGALLVEPRFVGRLRHVMEWEGFEREEG